MCIRLLFLLLLLVLGCDSSSAPNEPVPEQHPCLTAPNCQFDEATGLAACAEGFTLMDPADMNHLNCVPIQAGQCVPTSCAERSAECGSILDGCGSTLECGVCEAGQACGVSGLNQCGVGTCMPLTCAELGAQCGSVSDQCGEVISCGLCASGFVCNEQGDTPRCEPDPPACVVATCESLNLSCGVAEDGCGGTLNCGVCETCGNGQIEQGERCDSTQLNGESCESLGLGPGVLGCNADCTFNQTQCAGDRCPPNSSYRSVDGDEGCYCEEEYYYDQETRRCEPFRCPPNSSADTQDGEINCFCDDGYTINEERNGCVPFTCPPNSSVDLGNGGNSCICDEGYEVNATREGCVEIGCPPHSSRMMSEGGSSCVCDQGYIRYAETGDCIEVDCSHPVYAFDFGEPSYSYQRYTEIETEVDSKMILQDSVTGYMIQKCMAGLTSYRCDEGTRTNMDSLEADEYCETLTLGGFDDWELIPMEVLSSMILSRGGNGSGGVISSSFINAHIPFISGRHSWLITGSSITAPEVTSENARWVVSASNGMVTYGTSGYVRCARQTDESRMIQSAARCITQFFHRDNPGSSCDPIHDANDYCLLDHFQDSLTGLEWKHFDDRYTFGQGYEDQRDFCTSLQGDWRLPTLAEAFSLADYTRPGPPYVNYGGTFHDRRYFINASSDPVTYYGEPDLKWTFGPHLMRFEVREADQNGNYGTGEAFCVRQIP